MLILLKGYTTLAITDFSIFHFLNRAVVEDTSYAVRLRH